MARIVFSLGEGRQRRTTEEGGFEDGRYAYLRYPRV